jgi:hypothetical protein
VSTSLGLIVPFLLFLRCARGTMPFVMSALGGVPCGLSFSVVVVPAQTLLPGGKGFASTITVGAMFASGAAGNIVSHWIEDRFGLTRSLQSLAFVALGAALCAQALAWETPRSRKVNKDRKLPSSAVSSPPDPVHSAAPSNSPATSTNSCSTTSMASSSAP